MSTNVSDQRQYVEFVIGDENYAIPISEIHEIIKMQSITELPYCQHYIRGVINLRGKIVPVISLRSLFSLPQDSSTKATRIVVVKHSEDSVGIIVDRVSKVTTFQHIQPPPEHIGAINGAYFTGIGVHTDNLAGILNLNEVLVHE